jgi:hypothetical protein
MVLHGMELTMRTVTLVTATLATAIMLAPAHSVELRDCGSIKDPAPRMECLERNTIALNTALEAATKDLRSAVKALEDKVANTHAAIGKLESVNIMSKGPEQRCIHDDRKAGLNLGSCSSSSGWKLVPR